jgi:uncharacterized protein
MSLAESLVKRSDRFLDSLRHPEASKAAVGPASATDFGALRGHKYCLLVTFRQSGEAVPTPVWFGLEGDCVVVNTRRDNAKVKRISHDHRARVGPCSFRGRPRGPLAEGRARIVPPSGEPGAERALRANYGIGRRVYQSLAGHRGLDTVYLEISPLGGTG